MSFDLLYFGVLRIFLVNKTRVIREIFSIYPVLYTCPNGGYLNEVSSVHDNKNEDGRYRFRCCTPKSGKYLPHILFFKITEEFKMVFSLLLVFVLWYYFACRLLMAEMPQKRCNLSIDQSISLSIFLKDITPKKLPMDRFGQQIGWIFLTSSLHLVTLSGMWIAFTSTRKGKYDIDRTNIIEWFEYESYKTETEKNP